VISHLMAVLVSAGSGCVIALNFALSSTLSHFL